MTLTDPLILNFNKNMSTAAVFVHIERAFDTIWHSGLLYKGSKFEYSTSLIKFISSYLSQRKCSVPVEGKMSMLREMRAGVPQGSVLSPTLYNMYINDVPPRNTWCLLSPVCRRHLSVSDRWKGGFCCQKIPAWSQLNGDLV
jgi:hypothetical protein